MLHALLFALQTVSGTVFYDANGNGRRDAGERGVEAVAVSNQEVVVRSDANGAFSLPRGQSGIVFVTVPNGYRSVGAFWRAAGDALEFALAATPAAREFTFVHASDTHIAPASVARTRMLRALVDSLKPAFTLITGDLVRDALRVDEQEARGYYDLFVDQTKAWPSALWTVPGNHEIFGIERHLSLVSPKHPLYGRGMYRNYLGPDYYSFDYGGVHFVGLNSIDVEDLWYYGGIDSLQLAWLERDLALVAPETPVVTFNHIPFVTAYDALFGFRDTGAAPTLLRVKGRTVFRHIISNARDVLAVLRQRRHVLALGGHLHAAEKTFFEVEGVQTRFELAGAVIGPSSAAGLRWPSGITLYTVRNGVIDAGRFVGLGTAGTPGTAGTAGTFGTPGTPSSSGSALLLLAAQNVAITNVTVIDVERGRAIPAQTVLISGSRIAQVEGRTRPRDLANARVIDGTGKFVMPGMFDMHAHVNLSGRPTTIEMPLFIANGVTGLRVMAADCRMPRPNLPGCLEQYQQWRREIEAGTLISPRLLQLASWPVNGARGITDSMPSFFKAQSADDGRQLARYFKERGVDLIKVYQDIPRDGFFGLAEEARKLDVPFAGHDPTALSVLEVSNAGMRSIEHARLFLNECWEGSAAWRKGALMGPTMLRRAQIDRHDVKLCNDVFRTMAKNRTWYVPTHLTRKMDAFADDSAYRQDARTRYIPKPQLFRWAMDAMGMVRSDSSRAGRQAFMDYYYKGLELTHAAFRAGVPIMMGTDAGDSYVFPGFSVHDELEELVKAGLSPAEALKVATLNPAEYLGRTSDFGTVQKGRYADLIVLDANPLESVSNTKKINMVLFNGKVLTRAELDKLLADVMAEAARSP